MVFRNSRTYTSIREYVDTVPVIDTHEHYEGIIRPVTDVFEFVLGNYIMHDLLSSCYGMENRLDCITSTGFKLKGGSFEERHVVFSELLKKTDKGAYAKGLKTALEQCWGIKDFSIESLSKLQKLLRHRNQQFYYDTMDRCNIRLKTVDILTADHFIDIVEGVRKYSDLSRFSFPLPWFHNIRKKQDILILQKYLKRRIVCLDDYLESFEIFFEKCVKFGIVCIKDQSAYIRSIEYKNPSRAEAERVFNEIISYPRQVLKYRKVRKLDDWLFHYFMRLARKHDLPVQIHTGHMAGIRNNIMKANAAKLIPILELYKDIRFVLFHGNWPFMDEYLFLGKNYPNVWLDLCWVQLIDPVYSVEFLKRAIVTLPHPKVLAFGGDSGEPEWTAGYLSMARDNVAFALSEMINAGWLNMNEAKALASDWFFNNPSKLFKLGFEEFKI